MVVETIIHQGLLELQFEGLSYLVLLSYSNSAVLMMLQILDILMLVDYLKWKFKMFLIDSKSMEGGGSSKWFTIVLLRLPKLTACRCSEMYVECESKS